MIKKEHGMMMQWRYYGKYVAVLLWCGFSFLFFSCDNEDIPDMNKEKPDIETGVPVVVNFTVNEIGYGESEVVVRNMSTPYGGVIGDGSGVILEEQLIPLTPLSHSSREIEDDMYMYVTLTEDKEQPVRLRAMLLNQDARVRIMAYDISGSDTTLVSFADYEALSDGITLTPAGPPMTILSGDYMFVAYSFNSDTYMSAFADTTGNDIISKDALWGKTPLTHVGPKNHTVSINMAHLFSKFTMTATLDIPDAGNLIDDISGARISTYKEPRLIVQSGRLLLNPGALIDSVYFDWPSFGGGKTSAESFPQYIYMNGQSPVTVKIQSASIDTHPYSINGSYPPVNFNTILQGGKSYTFTIHFMRGPSGSADILYIDNDTLKIGRWCDGQITMNNLLFFKFGSVIGFKAPSTTGTISWATMMPLIVYNPTSISIVSSGGGNSSIREYHDPNGTLPGIPSFRENDNPPNKNVSIPTYHNGTNVKAGRGDPCKLVGYTATYIRGLSAAAIDALPVSVWRLPTANENIDFVRAPTSWYVNGTVIATPTPWNNPATYWGGPQIYGKDGGYFPMPGARQSPPSTRGTDIHTNPNGFLPVTGIFDWTQQNGITYNNVNNGAYWSGDVNGSDTGKSFLFNSSNLYPASFDHLHSGRAVRCVKN